MPAFTSENPHRVSDSGTNQLLTLFSTNLVLNQNPSTNRASTGRRFHNLIPYSDRKVIARFRAASKGRGLLNRNAHCSPQIPSTSQRSNNAQPRAPDDSKLRDRDGVDG